MVCFGGPPRILATRPEDANMSLPRPYSIILHPECRIQDTGYKIQQTSMQDTAYKIQQTSMQAYKDTKMQDTKMQRIQDTGIKQAFAAWWPLYRGAGGYVFFSLVYHFIVLYLSW